MRYAKIREMDITNGTGVGVSLFVQGCHFHCRGCFNQETWDFSAGKLWTPEIKQKFFELIDRPFIQRVSFLGGEPLCDENAPDVANLINEIKERFPEKHIWLYTGYNFDQILADRWSSPAANARYRCITAADTVVDGPFQLENQDLYNEKIVFAGSTNQRIIDVKKYLEALRSGGDPDQPRSGRETPL